MKKIAILINVALFIFLIVAMKVWGVRDEHILPNLGVLAFLVLNIIAIESNGSGFSSLKEYFENRSLERKVKKLELEKKIKDLE